MASCNIIISPSARQQIVKAATYIRDKLGSPKAAISFLNSIEDKLSVLAVFPNAYPIDEKASYLSRQEIRSVSMKAHRLLYRFDAEKNEIHILSLRFGSENPKSLKKSDLQD